MPGYGCRCGGVRATPAPACVGACGHQVCRFAGALVSRGRGRRGRRSSRSPSRSAARSRCRNCLASQAFDMASEFPALQSCAAAEVRLLPPPPPPSVNPLLQPTPALPCPLANCLLAAMVSCQVRPSTLLHALRGAASARMAPCRHRPCILCCGRTLHESTATLPDMMHVRGKHGNEGGMIGWHWAAEAK